MFKPYLWTKRATFSYINDILVVHDITPILFGPQCVNEIHYNVRCAVSGIDLANSIFLFEKLMSAKQQRLPIEAYFLYCKEQQQNVLTPTFTKQQEEDNKPPPPPFWRESTKSTVDSLS